MGPHFRTSAALGGDKRDRTADPLLAKQVLSQLSYTPVSPGRAPSKLNNVRVISTLSTSDLGHYKQLLVV